MIGIVDSVELSKTGKSWRVKMGGKYYGSSADSNIDQAKGKAIDFTFKSDPKFGDWIESWAYAQSAPQAAAQTAQRATTNQVAMTPGVGTHVDRWYMPFVSNTIAHAIQVGLITQPSQITGWAKSAKEAAEALEIL